MIFIFGWTISTQGFFIVCVNNIYTKNIFMEACFQHEINIYLIDFISCNSDFPPRDSEFISGSYDSLLRITSLCLEIASYKLTTAN